MSNVVHLNNYQRLDNFAEHVAWEMRQDSVELLSMADSENIYRLIEVENNITETFKNLAKLVHAIRKEKIRVAVERQMKALKNRDGYGK